MDEYPYENGDVIVLGPQVFVSRDEAVLNWKGCNYVPQEDTAERDRLRAVVEAARDFAAVIAAWQDKVGREEAPTNDDGLRRAEVIEALIHKVRQFDGSEVMGERDDSTESPAGSPGSHVAAAVSPAGGRDVGTGNPDVPPSPESWDAAAGEKP